MQYYVDPDLINCMKNTSQDLTELHGLDDFYIYFFKGVGGGIAIRNLKINPKCSPLINFCLGHLGEGRVGYFSS